MPSMKTTPVANQLPRFSADCALDLQTIGIPTKFRFSAQWTLSLQPFGVATNYPASAQNELLVCDRLGCQPTTSLQRGIKLGLANASVANKLSRFSAVQTLGPLLLNDNMPYLLLDIHGITILRTIAANVAIHQRQKAEWARANGAFWRLCEIGLLCILKLWHPLIV